MTTPVRFPCSSAIGGGRLGEPDMQMTPTTTARAVREFRRLARLLLSRERPDQDAAWITWQVRALYREIPDLVLTLEDVKEAFGLDCDTSALVLKTLTDVGFLRRDGSRFMAAS